jgi:hypothetical protein
MADIKIIVNCETGEVSEVELTAAEVKQREADAIAYAKAKAEEEEAAAEKASAKAAIAERLGLTDAELATLLA